MAAARLEVVKRVRVTPQDAAHLAQDAVDLGLTESEAMRLGLTLVHRLARRRRHGPHLLALAEVQGDNVRAEWPA